MIRQDLRDSFRSDDTNVNVVNKEEDDLHDQNNIRHMDDHKAGPQFSFELTESFHKAFKKCKKLSLSFRKKRVKSRVASWLTRFVTFSAIISTREHPHNTLRSRVEGEWLREGRGVILVKRLSNMWKLPLVQAENHSQNSP